jgi:geranyl-CoA carboxylase alpha subunit
VTTNKGFLIEMLAHPGFADGSATTAFIGDNFPDEKLRAPHQVDLARMLAATILVDVASAAAPAGFQGWWSTGQALAPVKLAQGDEVQTLTISQQRSRYDIGGTVIDILSRADGFVRFLADGREGSARYAIDDTNVHVDFEGRVYSFEDKTYAPAASKQAGSDGIIRAPMSGRIVSVSVKAGDNVEKGQLLAVLEAMKMEHQLKAVVPGKVENVSVVEGAQVESRQVLVTMVKEEAPAKADA